MNYPRLADTRSNFSSCAPLMVEPAARLRSRRHGRRSSPLASLGKLVLLAGAAILALLFVAGAAVDRAYQNRVVPGVRYAQISLGGLTEAEAKDLLDVQASSFLASPAVFAFGEREWHPSAQEMGLALDTQAMAREALEVGRRGSRPWRWLRAALAPLRHPAVHLHATLDLSQLAAFLSAVALEVDRAPVNAGLVIKNGQVSVGTAAAGQRVDLQATMQQVRLPRRLGDVQRIPVVVVPAPPALTEEGIAEARTLVAKILSAPLTLRAGSHVWTLTPAQLGTMVELKPVPQEGEGSGQRLVAALNEARVASYVRSLAAQFDQPAVDAQLHWTGSGVTVTRESRDGIKLDQPAAVKAILEHATQDARDITLATTVVKPAVTGQGVAQLGITGLLATGSSKFAGSPPERANNIKVAAMRLDGTVIPPGAIFSFLDALGPITKENGYQEGLTIQGDATVPGIGGGVCQVSTTMFRAAFYAGLPIVERHQHSYRVGYYEQDGSPVGFDAAVYDPGVDLRFKNDTGAAILIQAAFDAAGSTLSFRLYGTPAGREVKLAASKANETPAGPPLPDQPDPTLPRGVRKQVEWRADGVDATIRRTVLQNGQTLFSDSFFSRYAPWREKWVVGTG